jgi:hypothetical protein
MTIVHYLSINDRWMECVADDLMRLSFFKDVKTGGLVSKNRVSKTISQPMRRWVSEK